MPKAAALTAGSRELAEWLAVTDRRVRQLTEQGVLTRGRGRRYDVRESVRNYLQYLRRSPEDTVGTLEFARRRKVEAEAALQEIALGQKRGELMAVSDAVAQLASRFERVRASLLNVPGKYAPQFLGIQTIPEAQIRLEMITTDALTHLTQTADEDDDVRHWDLPGSESAMGA